MIIYEFLKTFYLSQNNFLLFYYNRTKFPKNSFNPLDVSKAQTNKLLLHFCTGV